MTLTTPYQASFYVGDGVTKTFPFVFEEVSDNFVKVIVSHIDGTTSIPTYTVDLDLKQVVFGDETPAPTADDIVCIYRETPTIQDTPFKTLEGYNAKALENILSKIVAMIQEIKSNYFSTQVLQGDPWQLDLLKSADDGATVNIDYVAKKLVKGLYFQITNGNLQVSADGISYITMPKSADIVEFRQVQTVLEDLTVQYRLQYRIGNEWFNAESNAEATADEAKQIAEEARNIASDAKDIAQDASDKVDGFDDRITQAEQDASDAKDIAQDASDAVSAHITDTNNPHSVTVAQIGALPDTTKYGAALSLTIDSTTYVVTAQLKDQDGNNLGTAQTIDLPLESVVVSGSYDSATKEVVLTLQGGSTIKFSVADLVSGLQTEITALNMLDADLVDDTTSTHKFVTTTEKSTWNGKQDEISDLATIRSDAQAGKAASDTIATYGDIVTHNVSEFATATQGTKADTALQTGDNVSELVNDAGYLVMGDLTNFVTKNTAQTISGLKTFSADITLNGTTSIKNTTNGVSYTMLYRDASGIHVGTSTQALLFAGSNTRPKFNNNDIAMLSDIPTAVSQLTNDTGFITNAVNDLQNYTLTSDLATVATSGSYNDLSNKPTIPTVNDATITITQGGVTKGSFSLNQASGDTIALDAGGGGGSGYYPDLFDWKWADHEISDMSWLRADTFSWQDGTVYSDAYQHLADDISGKTLQSETIDGTTIQFYLADDGHKICPATQESNVTAIYTATGVAWYYILDTDNTRFKLPRTKFGVTGLRDTVGKYVAPGLPNITGSFNTGDRRTHISDVTGAFYRATASSNQWVSQSGVQGNTQGVGFDASGSNSIYGNSTTVQPPATQQYLYFYVGQFSQSAVEQTAGLNASLFNGKADTDLNNLSSDGEERVFQPGIVLPFAGSTAPSGWLVCDGSAVSRTTYADLFTTIGTTYGVGDGSTTFNLPNISDCFVQGGTPGTTHSAGLPNITGSFLPYASRGAIWANSGSVSGAFKRGTSVSGTPQTAASGGGQSLDFDASGSNSIYGNSTTVQPKSVAMLYCIKY